MSLAVMTDLIFFTSQLYCKFNHCVDYQLCPIILVGKLGTSKGVYAIGLVNSEVCVSGVFPCSFYQGSSRDSPSTCLVQSCILDLVSGLVLVYSVPQSLPWFADFLGQIFCLFFTSLCRYQILLLCCSVTVLGIGITTVNKKIQVFVLSISSLM